MDKKKQGKAGGLIAVIAQKLKANKKLEYAVYIGIALLIIALYVSSLFPAKEAAAPTATQEAGKNAQLPERDVERRLEDVLGNIRGAGTVDVMITYETGPEIVTAMSTDTNTNRSETTGDGKTSSSEQQTENTKPATMSGGGGSEPIIITQKQPVVRGVIVIADGASDLMVRMNLQRAVQAVLNVPVGSIEVFERESTSAEE